MSDNSQEKSTIRYQVRRMRFRAMRTRLRLPVTWLLHRRLDPRDVFIASFPRSGSHWLKFQLLEIITGQAADFENVKRRITRVGDHGVPGAAALVALGVINSGKAEPLLPDGSRLMHTHEPYRREYRKVIYLVRDIRDVLLSEFAIGKELGLLRYYEIDDFDSFLEPFLIIVARILTASVTVAENVQRMPRILRMQHILTVWNRASACDRHV